MIPSVFLIPPALGCLIAARYAAFYWDVSAELWTVFKEPIEVSPAQVKQFAQLFPMNARPVMPLNRRFLLESR